MVEINNDTMILILGFIVGIIILKLLGKFVHRVVGVLILALIGLFYTYFYTDYFIEHKDNKVIQKIEKKMSFVSIVQYQKEHCNKGMLDRSDSVTCECIVAPLVEDLKERLTEEEIKSLEKDKQLYLKEIMTSLKRTQKEIQFNLKEKNAIHLWNRMVMNLKEGKMIGEE